MPLNVFAFSWQQSNNIWQYCPLLLRLSLLSNGSYQWRKGVPVEHMLEEERGTQGALNAAGTRTRVDKNTTMTSNRPTQVALRFTHLFSFIQEIEHFLA